MMKSLLTKLALLTVVATFLIPSTQVEAQYCGFDFVQWWRNYAIINDVVVEDLTEGATVLERLGTGYEQWATIDETEGPYEFNIGNDFELQIEWGVYYRGWISAWIDKNDDQRWDPSPMGPDEEYLGREFRASGFNIPPPINFSTTFPFSIGDDVPEGPGVMRLIASYFRNSTDACVLYFRVGYQWGYGEAEDYAINFVAPIPETYPTNGNILFNNERYDGTTRMFNGNMVDFKLPAVEFKGPQASGVKYMYEIAGPLPSDQVVYTALDPVTGEPEISINTTDTYFEVESATGSAAVDINEGTFLPSRGGEYKVTVTLIKPSGKRNQGINVFTVANNYDMSVASIISPRTSRFPRFFKYLVNTNIAMDCEVQNTGLNPVSKFEVEATIYDADTDNIVEVLPKVVYDADNDPNLFPLQSGEKYEVNFASFRETQVGEFYIVYEVTYDFDEEDYNNYLPRPDAMKHYFEIQYNDQLSAGEFINPLEDDTLKVNKPFSPEVLFENNGISDASNINFRMIITNEAGDEVYNEVSFLEDLPQGRYNERIVTFPTGIIREPGMYTGTAWVDYVYDSKREDDTTTVTFYVEKGIQDTITVGETNALSEVINNDVVANENPSDEDNQVRVETNDVFTFNSITPNPANTSTRLDFVNTNNETLNLEVVDMNGRVVRSLKTNDASYELNVSDLSSGIYTIVVRSGNTIQTKQLNVAK
ncbi:MAG: T9SS type A sorting domain-containing protein [Chlorobiota bacterium]